MARKSGDQRIGQERRTPPPPSDGDRQRRSTGSTAGARGQDGFDNAGKETWVKEQLQAERRQEQGRRQSNTGPRGRRKSDESLTQEIREILTEDPELELTDIEVQVEGGAVTLRGLVVDPDARLLAEELVETLAGVVEVHNRLRVKREEE